MGTLRKPAGGKRWDLGELKAALADDRVSIRMGLVKKFDGETSHWFTENGDVFVDVELAPFGQPTLCRLVSVSGGWVIPPEGSEVVVGFPQDDFEGNPILFACTTSGTLPYGLAENTLVIIAPAGGTVQITDGSGTAVSLTTINGFLDHTHLADGGSGSPTGGPITASVINGGFNVMLPPDPITNPHYLSTSSDSGAGTSVLKGK